jgi:predicted transcriptional regulator
MSGLSFWEQMEGAKRALVAAKIEYAHQFLRAKIRKDVSDGMAHQIAIEETHAALAEAEADFDIYKAMAYHQEER